jgi:hypothetical protein
MGEHELDVDEWERRVPPQPGQLRDAAHPWQERPLIIGSPLRDAAIEPDGSLEATTPPTGRHPVVEAIARFIDGQEVLTVPMCPWCLATHHFGRVALPALLYALCGNPLTLIGPEGVPVPLAADTGALSEPARSANLGRVVDPAGSAPASD